MTEPTLFLGDCLFLMKDMSDNSIDTIITDPPYGLHFMGKKWDYEVPSVEVFTEMLRIAKCGATLLCFGGTRTWHRIAVNIEDAGWEIRDTLMWLYGSGFPKSLDIGKAIDKLQGNERKTYLKPIAYPDSDTWGIPNHNSKGNDIGFETQGTGTRKDMDGKGNQIKTKGTSAFEGYGTALKPAFEPIIMAMKPNEGTFAENALKYGVAGLNIDGSRIGTNEELGRQQKEGPLPPKYGFNNNHMGNRFQNGNPQGRFPANLLLDEEAAKLLDEQSGIVKTGTNPCRKDGTLNSGGIFGAGIEKTPNVNIYTDKGGASRFFYTAKASKSERNAGCEGLPLGEPPASARSKPAEGRDNPLGEPRANHHPTVKPLALMEYLCTLTKTPTDGIVLDPYMGSGTTGMACKKVGRPFIGIEISEEYIEIAKRRIGAVEVIVEKSNPQQVMDLGI